MSLDMRLACTLVMLLAMAPGAAVAETPRATVLTEVEASAIGAGGGGAPGSWIHLRADGALSNAVIFQLEDPPRLVIDLPEVENAVAASHVEVGSHEVARVRVARHGDATRVVVDAGRAPAPFAGRRILPAPLGLLITLGAPEPTELARAAARAAVESAGVAVTRRKAPEPTAPRPRSAVRAAPTSPPRDATVLYGMELDRTRRLERLLIFGEDEVSFRVSERDATTLVLHVDNALLDRSAARVLEPEVGGSIARVVAEESLEAGVPVVRFVIERAASEQPEVTRRGSMIAVEFPKSEEQIARSITLNFDDAPLQDVIREIARATGQAFLFGDKIEGRVTITVAGRVSAEEALELLSAALLLKGLAAVPTPGGLRKIVDIVGSPDASPFEAELPDEVRERATTTLVRLDAADAVSVVGSLQPWLSPLSQALVHRPTNSIILAGAEPRLRQLIALVRALDESAGEDLIVRTLRHRSADRVAGLLREAFDPPAPGQVPLEVFPDSRTNSLVVRAPPERPFAVRSFLARIDRPDDSEGALHVVRILNQDPDQIAQLLERVAGGARDFESLPAELEAEARSLAEPLVSQSAELAELAGTLAQRDFTVAVDRPSRSIVIRSDTATAELLRDLIDRIDLRMPQIGVEVQVLELLTSESLALGVDFFVPLSQPKQPGDLLASFLSNPSGGGLRSQPSGEHTFFSRFTRAPLLIPIIDAAGVPVQLVIPRQSVVVLADGREIASRVLIRPHLLMLGGEEHEIAVGDNIPVAVASSTQPGETVANPLEIRRDIQRQDVGLTLRLKPSLGAAGGVRLELGVESTELAASLAGPVQVVGPTIRQRRLDSTILLDDGELAVVGMSRQRRVEELVRGAPFLKDIPGFGLLFRANRSTTLASHLIIAVEARILRSPAEEIAETIRRRIAFERALARLDGLEIPADAPYALRVATRRVEADADAIAQFVHSARHPAQVSAWHYEGAERFDVYLTGFESLTQVGDFARQLDAAGWEPEVVVLPMESLVGEGPRGPRYKLPLMRSS